MWTPLNNMLGGPRHNDDDFADGVVTFWQIPSEARVGHIKSNGVYNHNALAEAVQTTAQLVTDCLPQCPPR